MGAGGVALLAAGLYTATLEFLPCNALGCLLGIGCGAVLSACAVARLIEPDDLP